MKPPAHASRSVESVPMLSGGLRFFLQARVDSQKSLGQKTKIQQTAPRASYIISVYRP